MNKWIRFYLLTGILSAHAGGCDTSPQEQVATFSADLFLQALAAYLL